jgi:hypothetical protein
MNFLLQFYCARRALEVARVPNFDGRVHSTHDRAPIAQLASHLARKTSHPITGHKLR